MKRKLPIISLFLIICVLTTSNNCPGFNGNDLLQSGKTVIMKGPVTTNPIYSYESPINFIIPSRGLDIAVTSSTIGDYTPLPISGFTYYIDASRKGLSNSIVYRLVINNNQTWTSMQISYLVSGRDDIALGNFDVPTSSWLPATSNIFNVINKIQKVLPMGFYKVAAFISGFSTQASQFSIVINNKLYDNIQNHLLISFYSSGNAPLTTMTLAYVIYPQIHPILDFSYNAIPQGDAGAYQISGPVVFESNTNGIQYNEWMVGNRFLACTGNECQSTCILREDCFMHNGNIWQDKCIFCAPGVVFQFGQCSRKCGANQIYANLVCICANGFTRQGRDCVNLATRTCGTNQIYSDSLKNCACSQGCYDSNKNLNCLQCPIDSLPTPDMTSCICNDNSKFWNPNTNLCQNRCSTNQQWINNQCVCNPSSCWYNQACRQCPAGSISSPDFSACICNNPISYYFPFNNTCIQCNTLNYQILNHDKSSCVCQPGYILNTKTSKCQINAPQCNANQMLNTVTNKCDCLPGLVRNGVSCILPCGSNQIWNGQFCVCQPGSARYGVCKACPIGSQPNIDSSACICTSANQIFTMTTFACISCPLNSSPNVDKTSCLCSPGFNANSNGLCVQNCIIPEVYSNSNMGCVCQSGWQRNSQGRCQISCKTNEILNGNGCVCISGFVRNNGICTQCPASSQPTLDQTACVCIAGFTLTQGVCLPSCKDPLIFNPALGACQCKSGYTLSGTLCVPNCPSGQQWNGVACACPNGQALYGTCKICPLGTLPNSDRTACICTDSLSIFSVDSFSCLKCPPYSSPNPALAICSCNAGFVPDSNGGCSLQCGANQVANYTLGACQCSWGYYLPPNSTNCQAQCNINQQYNGRSCNCQPGCGKLNNICTLCPLNSFSNSNRNSCKCIIPNTIFNPISFACQTCPPFSTNSIDGTQCICFQGYQSKGGSCQPMCNNANEQLNKITNKCDCKYGFIKLGQTCVQRCGMNLQWTGTTCRCKQGCIQQNSICKPCPDNTTTNPSRSTCLWNNNQKIFDFVTFTFIILPPFAIISQDFTNFTCQVGYNRVNNTCSSQCPINAIPDSLGNCACTGGLYLDSVSRTCKQPTSCPVGSVWNASSLQCICTALNQYIFNAKCMTCGDNSFYSTTQKQCTCNTGFFNIGGICTSCDPRTIYNGTDCVCQLGYFGTRNLCNKCHASCSVCLGPAANQCQTCADVSLVLQNGYCTKNSPCDPGFFIDETNTKTCQKCSDNCIICDDIFQCSQCAIGYQSQPLQINNQNVSACLEICGDGIKYQAECDDGNTQNGDGCSSTCFIQPGWSCFNGSSVQKSICIHSIPDSTVLTSMGIVNLGDRVIQSVRASYLPDCITQNQCSDCFKALTVNVIQSNVPILCTVSFVPFSQWQFLVQYNFQGLLVTSKFQSIIKLNQAFKGCFSDSDFDQQVQISIDPAFLAKVDPPQTLTLDDTASNSNSTKISQSNLNQTLSSSSSTSSHQISIPSAAKNILKINN